MSEAAKHERREVLYRGQVQGVGFRYRCRQLSEGYAVSGYVQNLPDGSVKLVAEGPVRELDRFLTDVATALEVHIRRADIDRSAASGEFSGFSIRH